MLFSLFEELDLNNTTHAERFLDNMLENKAKLHDEKITKTVENNI